eukprot:2975775-Ditylum_brightwellii.AAC.1
MAGFPKDELWYVGRTFAGVPASDYVKLLFPKIKEWREEMNSVTGNKHAYNLLYKLLPFLSYVAVQD